MQARPQIDNAVADDRTETRPAVQSITRKPHVVSPAIFRNWLMC